MRMKFSCLFLIGVELLLVSGCNAGKNTEYLSESDERVVSTHEFGEHWPLIVECGTIRCNAAARLISFSTNTGEYQLYPVREANKNKFPPIEVIAQPSVSTDGKENSQVVFGLFRLYKLAARFCIRDYGEKGMDPYYFGPLS